MSSTKVLQCINVGCRLTFSHRETRRRHIYSGKCKGVPPQTVQHKVESFEKKDGNFICNKCKVVITHRNNIRHHLKSCMLKKGVKVKLQCTLCTAEFDHLSQLHKHQKVHEKHNYVCSKCDMVFQREYHMKKHVVKCEVFKPTMTGAFIETAGTSSTTTALIEMEFEEGISTIPEISCGDHNNENIDFEINDNENSSLNLEDSSVIDGDSCMIDMTMMTPPRRRQYRHSKSRCRASFNINSILNSVETKERENSKDNMNTFISSTLSYFKNLIKDGRRGHTAKVEGAKLLRKVFGDNIDNIDFQMWLVEKFRLKDREELISFLDYESGENFSFTRLVYSKDVRQQIYDFWKVNLVISVHRSNGRHYVKISKSNLLLQVLDLEDPDITAAEKLQAHRYIATQKYRSLHKVYEEIHGIQIDFGTFVRLKPFYVVPPSEKEMEMCMCSNCLNPHCLYSAIKKIQKNHNLPSSLSEYFCKGMKCSKETGTNYYYRDCILGT